ncbi:hypothetical protein ES705_29521 [subsurface metagenome]
MTCASCAQTIEKELQKKNGVKAASVNFATEKAFVEYESGTIGVKDLEKAVKDAGYDVRSGTRKTSFKLGGMTCTSCAANVGITIGTGTDIAIEASDVTLMRGDLSSVVTAAKLSKATFRKIKQNLFWAYFYNTIAIPAAFLGFLHPIIAEAAMAMNTINVVTNANLLRFSKIKPDYMKKGQ